MTTSRFAATNGGFYVKHTLRYLRTRMNSAGEVAGFEESGDSENWRSVSLSNIKSDNEEKLQGLIDRTARVLGQVPVEWEGDLEDCAKAVLKAFNTPVPADDGARAEFIRNVTAERYCAIKALDTRTEITHGMQAARDAKREAEDLWKFLHA